MIVHKLYCPETIYSTQARLKFFIMKQKLGVPRPIFEFRRICFCNSAEKWSWNIKIILPKLYKLETISSTVALKLNSVLQGC